VPSDTQLQAGSDLRTQIAIVLAMGLRPCSGAVMVLLFAKVIGVYAWGVISATRDGARHFTYRFVIGLAGILQPAAGGAS
jgi:hypothetical protein